MTDPRPGQRWRHKNDTTYEVLLITNQKSTDERYQPQVVYRGLEGPIWSRPLSDWHRSMTLKEDK